MHKEKDKKSEKEISKCKNDSNQFNRHKKQSEKNLQDTNNINNQRTKLEK